MPVARSLALFAIVSMLAACSPDDAVQPPRDADSDAAADADVRADACAGPARPSVDALDAAAYDQACRTHADCVAISTVIFCDGAGCSCAAAAINVSAAPSVTADHARAKEQCRPASCFQRPTCGACNATLVTCVANRCALTPCKRDDCLGVPEGCTPACSANEVCAAHECRPLCASDTECTGGTKCNAGKVCLAPPGCELPDGGIADGGCATVCYGYCE